MEFYQMSFTIARFLLDGPVLPLATETIRVGRGVSGRSDESL